MEDVVEKSSIPAETGDEASTRPPQSGTEKPLRLLLVAYRFPPQGGGGVQRSGKLIKYLSRSGVDCTVLMGPERWSEEDASLLEEIPKSVTRLPVEYKTLFSVLVRYRNRIRNPILHRLTKVVLWAVLQLSLPDYTWDWFFPAYRAGSRRIREHRPDVILVTGPPWTPFLVAAALSRAHGIPLVLDYRDPWNESYLPAVSPWLARRLGPFVERAILRRAQGVLGAHRAILRRLVPHLPRGTRRIWIPNGFDPDDFIGEGQEARADGSHFVLGYTGAFFNRRLPRELFLALEELLREGDLDPEVFRFRMAGDLGVGVRLLAETPHLARALEFEGYCPHGESLKILRASDVNLVFESDDAARNRTTPGKFYETVRVGRPVLVVSPPGITPRLARHVGGCHVVHPDDREGLKKQILALYRKWGQGDGLAGPDPSKFQFYSRRHQAGRVLRLLQAVSHPEPKAAGEATEAEAAPRGHRLIRRAAINASSAAVGRVLGMVVSVVLTPIVLGGLGRDLYGVLTTAGSFFDYLTLFRGGLGSALRRHVTIRVSSGNREEAKRYYETGFWMGAVLRLPILLGAVFLARPLCEFVHLPESAMADGVTGTLLILIAAWMGDIATMFEVPVYATGNTAALSIFQIGVVLLRFTFVFAGFALFIPSLSMYGWILIALMGIFIVGKAALAQWANSVGPAIPRLHFGTSRIRRDLLTYGGMSLLEQISTLLWLTSDHLLIGRLFGAGEVAFYSIGARWMPLIRSFSMTMFRSIQPLFTQLEAEADEAVTTRATLLTIAVASIVAVPTCLVPCVLGDLFIAEWGVGSEYEAAYPILVIMLAPLTLDIALYPTWIVLSARGKIGWVSMAELFLALSKVAIGLGLALGADMGLLGFAWGNCIALLARALILRPISARAMPGLPSLSQMMVPLIRALGGGLPGLILLWLARPLYGDSLATIVLAGVIGGVICAVGAALATLGRGEIERVLRAVTGGSHPSNPTFLD